MSIILEKAKTVCGVFRHKMVSLTGVYREHFTEGEPDWLKEERRNFLEKLDKNGDGKLDKVKYQVMLVCVSS